jgi:SWIM zinc finger
MKFSSECKIAQKFKAWSNEKELTDETIEWWKNIHIPNCKKCRKKKAMPAPASKVTKSGERFKVPSFTNPKKLYTVTRRKTGYQCSCPAWIYSKDRRDCKHIEKIKKAA